MRPASDSGGAATAPRAVVFHIRPRHSLSSPTASEPIAIAKTDGRGIAIGRDQCPHDPSVAASHGTLECTPQHGVWVYVDHSERGTLLNHKQLLQRDAAIVRDGDTLTVGATDITLRFQSPATIDRQQQDNQAMHTVLSPRVTSALAKQLLPNINTDPRPPSQTRHQATPEYINSPIPGSNWRKKRHSISHVTTRMPISLAAASSSQIFSRSKPLVPSAPATPPQKDAAPRPVSHHHHVAADQIPQSAYYHVKWKDEPEPATADEHGEQPQQSPPLEYSSSPMTAASFLHHRPQQPTPIPPSAPPFDSHSPPPKTISHSTRPVDLRIQVAKRNASLATTGSNPPPSTATTKPAALVRGVTIANPSAPQPILKHSPQQTRRVYGDGLTPPASPVAHQDILRQKDSLLKILKTKMEQEQKLKEEQEEWIRRQQTTNNSNSNTHVPSMSPIRHETLKAPHKSDITEMDGKDGNITENDQDDGAIPPKAPALLRTVSLGHTIQVAHQPSPRLTAAVLASRAARKNSFDGRNLHAPPLRQLIASQDAVASATAQRSLLRVSHDSSVASSVSTEPANHRRVTRSLSISSSRSGELSDFLGYDDDDDTGDALLSFTSFFGSDDLPKPLRRGEALDAVLSPTRRPLHRPTDRSTLRSRAPSLDDEMAGMLNSPSHASMRYSDPPHHHQRHHQHHSSSAFGVASPPPSSVAKPRARSADLRSKPLFRRMHQLGIDGSGD